MKKMYYHSDFFIYLIILTIVILILSPQNLLSQFINNGSFEIHTDTTYPRGLTGVSATEPLGYHRNQLMKCIGFCQKSNPAIPWTPIFAECHKDTTLGSGWYWATLTASPDYFHMGGLWQAQVPYVGIYADSINVREYRYPYGYPSINNDDSAFVGLRIVASKPHGTYTFLSYKEYIQSKLNIPITGPKVYEVKFYISKSKHIWRSIKNIGIYFTQDWIIRPSQLMGKFWNTNLALDDHPPYNYLTKPQIYSDFLLDQTADMYGHGGWQEIKDYIFVDTNETYNFVTIGNFQSDADLWADITPGIEWPNMLNEYELYYFIDHLSISVIDSNYSGNCFCNKNVHKASIKPDSTNQDSSICCYNYHIDIPVLTYGICLVNKIIIRNGETILDEIIADYPQTYPRFNGMGPVTGSICLDKFTQNKDITIQFYTHEGGDIYSLLAHCTQNFEVKCRCDCDDLIPFSYTSSSPKFKLVKVDDSENGNCCWDMVLTNPMSNDENSCDLDLSYMYLHIQSSPNIAYYNFSGIDFTLETVSGYRARYKAPTELIITSGQSVNIGRICSYGAPANETELTFVFSHHTLPEFGVCDTVLIRKISCNDSIGCCNSFVLYADTIRRHVVDSISYCTTRLMLNYINTIEYCDFDDLLSVTVYDNTDQIGYINHYFKLSEVYSFPIVISPLIEFNGIKEFCIHIRNLRTQEECIQCILLFCDDIIPGEPMNKGNIENSSIDRTIKIVPNPTDNWVDLYFDSGSKSDGLISLYSVTGQELVSKRIKVQRGRNSARITTTDIPSGLYQVIIDIDGIIKTGTIAISR